MFLRTCVAQGLKYKMDEQKTYEVGYSLKEGSQRKRVFIKRTVPSTIRFDSFDHAKIAVSDSVERARDLFPLINFLPILPANLAIS